MIRVATFGTFDIFHPGHISFLRQAKKQGTFLLVIVARDKHVESAKNNKPRFSEKIRASKIRSSKIADKVVLGSKTHNYFRTLRTYKIDKIVLGYDQRPTLTQLRRALKKHRLNNIEISRARPYNPNKYKSSKLASYV